MRVSIYGVWIDIFKLLSIDIFIYIFIDMYFNDLLENIVMVFERNIFSIDDIVDEYVRLMDVSKEVMRVDKEEDDEFEIKVDRYLLDSVDRYYFVSDSWGLEKVSKVELK